MSEIKVDTVKGRDGVVRVGDSGDTITVPSGATLTTTDTTLNLPATVTATTESKTNKISPASGTAFTLGDSGDTFTIPSGVTMANSGTASGFGAGPVLIQSQTASSSASISFTTGLDNTYDEYIFYYINIQPATNRAKFLFQVNASGQTGFNEAMTTTSFIAYNRAASAGSTSLGYRSGADQVNSDKIYQKLSEEISNVSKGCTSGEFHLFTPSNTTYLKRFYQKSHEYNDTGGGSIYSNASYTAGYINVTAAITEIDFKMDTGNIAAGTIKLYGVS